MNYNGLGTRVKRVDVAAGTRVFLHDGLGPADDVVYDGSVSFSPGVSEHTSGGQDRYYNDDGLGSLTDLTDSSGNFLANRTWDAFGNQEGGSTFGYLHGYGEDASYQEDHDPGVKLCGLRYYDSSAGRFLTADPAAIGPNWYLYCDSDPTGEEDPLGLYPDGSAAIGNAFRLGVIWTTTYSSEDAAAVAATEAIWWASWKEHREYGGWVVRKGRGKFGLAGLYKGEGGGVNLPDSVPFRQAAWHTHPWRKGQPYPNHPEDIVGNPDNFSDGTDFGGPESGDIPQYERWRVDGYVRSEHFLKKWRYHKPTEPQDFPEGIPVKVYK